MTEQHIDRTAQQNIPEQNMTENIRLFPHPTGWGCSVSREDPAANLTLHTAAARPQVVPRIPEYPWVSRPPALDENENTTGQDRTEHDRT